MFGHRRAIDRIFGDRKKFRSSFPFTDGVALASKRGIDQPKDANRWSVVRLLPNNLFRFSASVDKCRTRSRRVTAKLSNKSLTPTVRERERFLVTTIEWHDLECVRSLVRVPFTSSQIKPSCGVVLVLLTAAGFHSLEDSAQRLRVTSPFQF